MTVNDVLAALEGTPIGSAVRTSDWLFPIFETIHVLGVAAVFGSILMVDLRLVGVASRNSAVSKLSAECLPYTWTAFVIAAAAGTLLFMSKAHVYFYNLQFELKFLCMTLAGINMLVFHFGAFRRVLDWDYQLPPPAAARVAGAVSIMLWVSVIFLGRWIGFTT